MDLPDARACGRTESWRLGCEAGRDGLSEEPALRQLRSRCLKVVRENFRAEASAMWTLASSLVILEPEQSEIENGVSLVQDGKLTLLSLE